MPPRSRKMSYPPSHAEGVTVAFVSGHEYDVRLAFDGSGGAFGRPWAVVALDERVHPDDQIGHLLVQFPRRGGYVDRVRQPMQGIGLERVVTAVVEGRELGFPVP